MAKIEKEIVILTKNLKKFKKDAADDKFIAIRIFIEIFLCFIF